MQVIRSPCPILHHQQKQTLGRGDSTHRTPLHKRARRKAIGRRSSPTKARPGGQAFRNADSSQATQPTTSTNLFAALEADNPKAEDAMDNLEEMREGWTFQGRKKHAPRIASLRQVLSQFTTLTPNHDVTPGGRRKRTHSNVHCSYFTSLGISSPPGQEHARARIWPDPVKGKKTPRRRF